jgi:cell division protein FtsZ
MTEMGKAMMGTGEASGEGRALMAAENAIQNPLLDEVSLKGAKAVLVNITGGLDMTLLEVDEAANAISNQVDPEANIIFGAAFDPALNNTLRVSVVATGMDEAAISAIEPSAPRARRPEPQPVARAPEPAPVAEPEPIAPVVAVAEPAPVFEEPAYEPPRIAARVQPVRQIRAEPEPEPELEMEIDFGATAAPIATQPIATQPIAAQPIPAQPIAAQPRVAQPQIVQPVTRIVDPSVADEDELDVDAGPMFPQGGRMGMERQQRGWLSIFGRPTRHDSPETPLRATGSGSAIAQPAQEPADDTEDLEIPSFLRRLAN